MFLPGAALPVRDEEKNVLHITRLKAVLNALSDSHPSERAIAPMGSPRVRLRPASSIPGEKHHGPHPGSDRLTQANALRREPEGWDSHGAMNRSGRGAVSRKALERALGEAPMLMRAAPESDG